MKDSPKTHQELLKEIFSLKQNIRMLERSEEARKQTESSQGENKAKWKEMFETIEDLYYETDSEGIIRLLSPSVCRLTGWDEEDLIGKPVSLVYADPYERKRLLLELLEKGFVLDYELLLKKKDGEKRQVSLSAHLIADDVGRMTGVSGLLRDITERKRAEEELRESKELYTRLVDTIPDVIVRTDLKGTILFVNDNTLQVSGYSREEIEGQNILRFISSEDHAKAMQNLMLMLERRLGPKEYHLIMKDGRKVPFEVNADVLRNEDGTPFGIVNVCRDISRRKQAEAEILNEKSKLKTLSDNAPYGLVLSGKESNFTYINKKFTELFGYDLSDVPDLMTWRIKAFPDPDYRNKVVADSEEDFRDARPGERIPRVFTITCKDGTQKTVQFITTILASGEHLKTCEDITELRKLEAQLRQAQKTEAIGTLTGGIAHDFNNILTAQMGYAALIRKKMDLDSPLRHHLGQIVLASQKATDLIKSLLAFSRQQPINLVPLNINSIIKNTEGLLRRLLTEDVELCISLGNDDTIIMADKSQMDQILFNLITNARDAMPKGGVLTIATGIVTIDNDFLKVRGFGKVNSKYAEITFSDTGEGMDEATLEKIYDPFFTTKEVGKGTGLGLATVYGIVQQHNGYIAVESKPNKGTTFHLYFPITGMRADEERDAAATTVTGNETILIAEDDDEVRHFVQEALQEYGYTIIEAVEGEDAMDKFRQNRPINLIILDSVMPKKNGREVYEEIHRIAPHVKVLFTSGYTKDIILDKGVEDGEFDFIAKPLLLDELLEKIRQILDRK